MTATDGATNASLGSSVAIAAATIVTGAPGDGVGANLFQGSAYTFARTGLPARTETAKLTDGDRAAGDRLGTSVAIDASTIVAGAPGDDVGANTDQGSASVFFQAQPPPPPPPPPPAKPVLSKLALSPSTFRTGSALTKISRSRTGTKITFALSKLATVRLSFAKATSGRRVGATCRPPSRSNRARPRCTRYVAIGSFTFQGRSGANTLRFDGVLSRRKRLAPGSYKLTATPTDSARDTGQPRTAKLTITAK